MYVDFYAVIVYFSVTIWFFLLSGIFALFDIYKPDWVYQRKIQTDIEISRKDIDRNFKIAFYRFIIESPLNLIFIISIIYLRGIEYTSIPDTWIGLFLTLFAHFVLSDLYEYASHKLLHSSTFYKYHKNTHDKYTNTAVSYGAVGRFENIFYNWMSILFPVIILGPSIHIFAFWTFIYVTNSVLKHSGYYILPVIPTVENYFHFDNPRSEFSSLGFSDTFFRTKYENIRDDEIDKN